MDQEIIRKINKEVYRRFPEIKGKKPKIQLMKSTEKKNNGRPQSYLLVYGSQVSTSTGQSMSRMVRVVATEAGEIIKITTSK
jgi:hypothetical protein